MEKYNKSLVFRLPASYSTQRYQTITYIYYYNHLQVRKCSPFMLKV